LSDALVTMMNARMICYDGHVVDALAIYDGVARRLRPSLSQTMPFQSSTTSRDDASAGEKHNDHGDTNYE